MSILKRYLRNEKGFTMIEMMVVLIIIAVLIAGGIKFYLGNIEKSKLSRARMELYNMAAILDAYYAETGQYPKDADEAIEMAGLPYEKVDDKKVLIKDPWGVNYSYTATEDSNKKYTKYTLLAVDEGNNKKAYAIGENGKSDVGYGSP